MVLNVFFELQEPVPPGYSFQHLAICLAEGLEQLGIPFCGNVDYWKKPDGGWLIAKGEMSPDDVLVVSSEILTHRPFPDSFFTSNCRKRVCLYDSDFDHCAHYGRFDAILKCHYGPGLPGNCEPWAFGLSRRMLEHCAPQEDRRWEVAVNWRMSHPIRTWAEDVLFPRIEERVPIRKVIEPRADKPEDEFAFHDWKRTGARHYPEYYKRLSETAMCLTFGGIMRSGQLKHFDSWRLWESWAAGCVPLHVDLERYRCVLPVMPRNGQHYVGFDVDNMDAGLQMLRPDIIKRISGQGQRWALENYSPKATAERFVSAVER